MFTAAIGGEKLSSLFAGMYLTTGLYSFGRSHTDVVFCLKNSDFSLSSFLLDMLRNTYFWFLLFRIINIAKFCFHVYYAWSRRERFKIINIINPDFLQENNFFKQKLQWLYYDSNELWFILNTIFFTIVAFKHSVLRNAFVLYIN